MRAGTYVAISAFAIALTIAAQGRENVAQGGKPVFPGQVDVVRLDIVALDAANRPVTDLKQDEIWILENGKKQDIVSFVPIVHAIPSTYRTVANDVAGNQRDDGRMIFIVLDDSNSLKKRTPFVKEAATRLVERLNPEDWVGMLWVSQDRRGALEFTQDHALVLRAIQAFAGEETTVERWFGRNELRPGPTALIPGGLDSEFPIPHPEGQPFGEIWGASLKALFDADRPILMVRAVSEQLRRVEARRRALVYIGQGTRRVHISLTSPTKERQPDVLLPAAMDAAKDANVTFYTIDVSDPAVRSARGPTATEGTSTSDFSALSDSTGGVTTKYANPSQAADRVVEATSVYYLAGYSPAPPKPKERTRTIEVRTTRPGVHLLARKSYVPSAKEPPTSPRLEAARAVRDLIPATALSLRAFAAPFADAGQKKQPIAVVLEFTLPEAAVPRGKAFGEDVDVILVAAAPGKGVKATDQLHARLTLDAEKAQGFSGRYLMCARIAVEPGLYQLRIGARSAAASRAGAVYLNVVVPDFSTEAVSLSGLVIGQTTSRESMPVARRSSLDPILPFTPSLVRDFTQEDEAWAFVRAYRGKEGGSSPVSLTTMITRLDDGTTAWTSPEETPSDLKDRNSADYRVALPLSQLPAGSYRLSVEATRAGESSRARRELDFRVTRE